MFQKFFENHLLLSVCSLKKHILLSLLNLANTAVSYFYIKTSSFRSK